MPAPRKKVAAVERASDDQKLRWLAVGSLHVDMSYQRALKMSKVKAIAAELDPDALGVIYVSHREGKLWIVDGQHRTAAVDLTYGSNEKVPCFVYSGLTVPEEAKLWSDYNGLRTKPTAIDRWEADLIAEKPDAVEVAKVFAHRGLSVATGPGVARVQAIETIREVHRLAGRRVLGDVLDICKNAWGPLGQGTKPMDIYHSSIVKALAMILVRKGSEIDKARMVRVLAKQTPPLITTRVATIRAALGVANIRAHLAVADFIVDQYNFRLSESKKVYLNPALNNGPAAWRAE